MPFNRSDGIYISFGENLQVKLKFLLHNCIIQIIRKNSYIVNGLCSVLMTNI